MKKNTIMFGLLAIISVITLDASEKLSAQEISDQANKVSPALMNADKVGLYNYFNSDDTQDNVARLAPFFSRVIRFAALNEKDPGYNTEKQALEDMHTLEVEINKMPKPRGTRLVFPTAYIESQLLYFAITSEDSPQTKVAILKALYDKTLGRLGRASAGEYRDSFPDVDTLISPTWYNENREQGMLGEVKREVKRFQGTASLHQKVFPVISPETASTKAPSTAPAGFYTVAAPAIITQLLDWLVSQAIRNTIKQSKTSSHAQRLAQFFSRIIRFASLDEKDSAYTSEKQALEKMIESERKAQSPYVEQESNLLRFASDPVTITLDTGAITLTAQDKVALLKDLYQRTYSDLTKFNSELYPDVNTLISDAWYNRYVLNIPTATAATAHLATSTTTPTLSTLAAMAARDAAAGPVAVTTAPKIPSSSGKTSSAQWTSLHDQAALAIRSGNYAQALHEIRTLLNAADPKSGKTLSEILATATRESRESVGKNPAGQALMNLLGQ